MESGGSSYTAYPIAGSWTHSSVIRDDREVFKRIGHLLIAWFLGLLGGVSVLTIHSLIRRRNSAAL